MQPNEPHRTGASSANGLMASNAVRSVIGPIEGASTTSQARAKRKMMCLHRCSFRFLPKRLSEVSPSRFCSHISAHQGPDPFLIFGAQGRRGCRGFVGLLFHKASGCAVRRAACKGDREGAFATSFVDGRSHCVMSFL